MTGEMERFSTAARVNASLVLGGSAPLLLALALVASGCGGSSGQADGSTGGNPSGVVSCTVSIIDGAQTVNMICYEGTGAALQSALQQQCSATVDAGGSTGFTSAGHFAQAPCSHAGAVGGCLAMQGGMSQTGWYYTVSGVTADQVRQLCAGVGATFVAP